MEWLYMRRVIVASGCSRSFGIFFALIGKVCHGVRRVREEGFEDFFEISKMVETRRGFSHGMKIAIARIVPKNIPKGF